MNDQGFIYTLSHPITLEIRYIGQTSKSLDYRLRSHINSSVREGSNEAKTPIGKWIKKLALEHMRPIISAFKQVPLRDLDSMEIDCIKEGKINWRLLNLAPGGRIEGRKKGSKQTIAFCERQSKEQSGIKNLNFKDLTGKSFNKLTVVKLEGFWEQKSWWLCRCACGKTKIVCASKLQRTLSCGCARKTRIISESTRKKISENNRRRKHANAI